MANLVQEVSTVAKEVAGSIESTVNEGANKLRTGLGGGQTLMLENGKTVYISAEEVKVHRRWKTGICENRMEDLDDCRDVNQHLAETDEDDHLMWGFRNLTPMHWAAAFGRNDMLEVFLRERSGSPNVDSARQGWKPIHMACRGAGDGATLTLLRKHGSIALRTAPFFSNVGKASHKENPIVWTVAFGNVALFNAMVDSIGDTCLSDRNLVSALCRTDYIEDENHDGAKMEMLDTLIGLWRKRKYDFAKRDRYGRNVLHTIADCNRMDIMDKLLQAGYVVPDSAWNEFDRASMTPLDVACMANAVDVAKFLLDHGAKLKVERKRLAQGLINMKSSLSPIRGERGERAKRLTEQDPATAHRKGFVPSKVPSAPSELHLASYAWASDVARLLVDRGMNVNRKDSKHKTPLHWALMSERPPIIDEYRQIQFQSRPWQVYHSYAQYDRDAPLRVGALQETLSALFSGGEYNKIDDSIAADFKVGKNVRRLTVMEYVDQNRNKVDEDSREFLIENCADPRKAARKRGSGKCKCM